MLQLGSGLHIIICNVTSWSSISKMGGSQNDTAHCILHLVMCLEFLKQNTPQLVKEHGMGGIAGQYVTGARFQKLL